MTTTTEHINHDPAANEGVERTYLAKPKAERTSKAKKDYRKLGVPAEYLNDKGGFRGPGWDAKLKSALIKQALEAEAAKKRTSDAHKLLAKLGWTAHLDKSREARKTKAAKKANGKTE
jgi:hypothetical protein